MVGKCKLGARAIEYELGARISKHKLGARANKYKLGARARAGGQAEDRSPGNINTRVKLF